MDPDANLREQLELAQKLSEAEWEDIDDAREDVYRLAELVLALDEWIRKGGFHPEPWEVTKVENRPRNK